MPVQIAALKKFGDESRIHYEVFGALEDIPVVVAAMGFATRARPVSVDARQGCGRVLPDCSDRLSQP